VNCNDTHTDDGDLSDIDMHIGDDANSSKELWAAVQ
jgi:hypothetical protein